MTGSKSKFQEHISSSRANSTPPVLIVFGERLGIPSGDLLPAWGECGLARPAAFLVKSRAWIRSCSFIFSLAKALQQGGNDLDLSLNQHIWESQCLGTLDLNISMQRR